MTKDLIKMIKQNQELETISDLEKHRKEAVSYIGTAQKHKTNASRIYLRLNPFSEQGMVLEFNIQDIVYAEEVQTLFQKDGSAVKMLKIWVKKGSTGVRLEPFLVREISGNFPSDYFD